MRHYAHHIGDYVSATAHLSFIEDAAYRRLLDRYYQDEKPLPPDLQLVCKLVRAVSRHEKSAVRRILDEFFTFTPEEGWRQCRADAEISKYKSLANHGRLNGLKGGRPKANHGETATKNQEPLTKNHIDIPRKSARKSKLPEDFHPTEERLAYAAKQDCADPTGTFEEFRLHHTAKGTLHLDWDAAWKFWCRNQKNFRRAQQSPQFARDVAAATVTDDDRQWTARMRGWRRSKWWLGHQWGPPPDQPDTLVPPHLLTEAT